MYLLDWNGFERLGSLRLGYGREKKTENSKGQSGWFHSKFTHGLP